MSKFYATNPQPATRQAVERFEIPVTIQNDNHYPFTLILGDNDRKGAVTV